MTDEFPHYHTIYQIDLPKDGSLRDLTNSDKWSGTWEDLYQIFEDLKSPCDIFKSLPGEEKVSLPSKRYAEFVDLCLCYSFFEHARAMMFEFFPDSIKFKMDCAGQWSEKRSPPPKFAGEIKAWILFLVYLTSGSRPTSETSINFKIGVQSVRSDLSLQAAEDGDISAIHFAFHYER